MDSDKYKTIKEKAISEGYYSEKRSKFLAFAHHVDSVEEALEIVKEYRKKYYDARHCCYAYRVGFDGTEFRAMMMENHLLQQESLYLDKLTVMD